MDAIVHAADVQDRDGGVLLIGDAARNVSVSAEALRRCGLPRAEVSGLM